jgi:DNA-binding NarL/FixJ family response regulator
MQMKKLSILRQVLTGREAIVLKLLSKGCTAKQIAGRLYISVDTVKKHLQNSYRKLEAYNKITALKKAGML